MYMLEFQGGQKKIVSSEVPDAYVKFHLFFILGQKEYHITDLVNRQTVHPGEGKNVYLTDIRYVKIFMVETEYGNRWLNLFVRLSNSKDLPMITIKSFKKDYPLYFKARGKFLKKKDYLPLLDPKSQSYQFAKKQTLPSRSVLRSIISLNYPRVPDKSRKLVI